MSVHIRETDGKYRLSTFTVVDVKMVRWPTEVTRRSALQRAGRPRLLLVEPKAPPPVVEDHLEDWIRIPADEMDLRARVEALSRRAPAMPVPPPEVDHDGVLRFDGRWVAVPPVEARLVDALIARIDAVVSRDDLARSGWPGGSPGRNALDVHMLRLRRRIEPLGLQIRTVRSRGYLLESVSDSSQQAVAQG